MGSGRRQTRLAASTTPNWPSSAGRLQASPNRNLTLPRSWGTDSVHTVARHVCQCVEYSVDYNMYTMTAIIKHDTDSCCIKHPGLSHNVRVDPGLHVHNNVSLNWHRVVHCPLLFQFVGLVNEGLRVVYSNNLLKVRCQLKTGSTNSTAYIQCS